MKELLRALHNAIFTLTHPSYWLMNNPYSKEYDIWLRKAIKEHKFTKVSGYESIINGKTIWVENYPYGGMCLDNIRPSRLTVYEAYKHYIVCKLDL